MPDNILEKIIKKKIEKIDVLKSTIDIKSLNEIIEPKIEEISENIEQNIIRRNENSPPSLLSSDLFIKGNLTTNGDIQIEGEVEGNILAVRQVSLTQGRGWHGLMVLPDDETANHRGVACERPRGSAGWNQAEYSRQSRICKYQASSRFFICTDEAIMSMLRTDTLNQQ